MQMLAHIVYNCVLVTNVKNFEVKLDLTTVQSSHKDDFLKNGLSDILQTLEIVREVYYD